MKLGNDWRNFEDFTIKYKGNTWEVLSNERGPGYYVWAYKVDGPEEVSPVLYNTKRNGTDEVTSIETHCEGFAEAIAAEDSVFYITE